jgi:hypothetical protein
MSAAKATRSDAADRQKKIIAGVVFGLIAVGVIYWEVADPGSPSAAPAPVVVTAPATGRPATTSGTAARNVGTTAGALDPTLHMQAMLVTESVLYNGTGRNVFAVGGAAPVEVKRLPTPIASVRTGGRPVTTPVINTGPPPPPPIPLKFFGVATTGDGRRQAFLLHGDDVFLAANGDIVQRKYRVVTIGPNSVQVEDLSTNNKQTLPLEARP